MIPRSGFLKWLLAAMIWSLANDTCLEPVDTEDIGDLEGWDGLVSMGTLAPPTDCFETTSEAEG